MEKNKVKKNREGYYFSGSVTFAAALADTKDKAFPIEAGKSFILESFVFRTVNANTGTAAAFLFSLLIKNDSKDFFSDYVICEAFGGNHYRSQTTAPHLYQSNSGNGRPINFVKPLLFKPSTNLKLYFRNDDPDTTNATTLYFACLGFYQWD